MPAFRLPLLLVSGLFSMTCVAADSGIDSTITTTDTVATHNEASASSAVRSGSSHRISKSTTGTSRRKIDSQRSGTHVLPGTVRRHSSHNSIDMDDSGSFGTAGSGSSGISGSGIGTINMGTPGMGTSGTWTGTGSSGRGNSGISGSGIGTIDLGTGGTAGASGTAPGSSSSASAARGRAP